MNNETMHVRVEITIEQPQMGGRLMVSDDLQLPNRSFLEVCEILAQFHELANQFRRGDLR